MENSTDNSINAWLELDDLVQANQTYKTLMDRLKNFLGADMSAKEYNDVYGQVELDYAREFDEGNIEQQVQAFNQAQLEEEFKRAAPSGC